MRRTILAGAVPVLMLVAPACGDDDASGSDGTLAAGVSTTESESAPEAPGSGDQAGGEIDMCDYATVDDIAAIVTAAATDPSLVSVDERPPPSRGACGFTVETLGTGGSFIYLNATDDWLFDSNRQHEDTTERSGLGDEAYTFHGIGGPELHVRRGSTYFSVQMGSFDDRFGITSDTQVEIAELVLSRL